jgi:hypothetical protein
MEQNLLRMYKFLKSVRCNFLDAGAGGWVRCVIFGLQQQNLNMFFLGNSIKHAASQNW